MTTSGPIGDDLDRIARGKEASLICDHVDLFIEARGAQIAKGIYKEIDKNPSLDPARAVQAWIALAEGRKLSAFIHGEVKRGVQAGERAKPHLEAPPTEKTP